MTSDLEARSREFAGEISTLVADVFGTVIAVNSFRYGDRFVVRPGARFEDRTPIPLTIDEETVATLDVALHQTLDHAGMYLKTTKADFRVYSTLDRTPLVRLEYQSDARSTPVCHWHVHAERSAFGAMLALAHKRDARQVSAPHQLSSLHFPVGGERFRPCLEDVLEFLIVECGIDAAPGWKPAVEEGRRRWRMRQFRTSVRDLQDEAADVLRDHGWTLTPPDEEYTPHLAPYGQW